MNEPTYFDRLTFPITRGDRTGIVRKLRDKMIGPWCELPLRNKHNVEN